MRFSTSLGMIFIVADGAPVRLSVRTHPWCAPGRAAGGCGLQAGGVEFPVSVALAQSVPDLPEGPGWWFEPKFDGHRTLLWREPGQVRMQARSGRDVTSVWADLARAGAALPAGTVLDGEAVVFVDGVVDFAAAQSRAASSPARAARLAEQYPASFATGVRTGSFTSLCMGILRSQQVRDQCSRHPSSA